MRNICFLFFCFSSTINCYFVNNKNLHSSPSTVLNAKPKPAPKPISKNVEYYIKMKEINRLKQSGESYEAIKQKLTNSSQTLGYQKLIGRKGTLDQRLRAIIAYKRDSSVLTGMSSIENSELESLESGEGIYDDDDVEENDEDLMYESMIQELLQKKQLQEIKNNFLVESGGDTNIFHSNNQTIDNNNNINNTTTDIKNNTNIINETKVENKKIKDEDMYKPANPSWGLFERPRNMSKAYGGGRVITKEEIARLNAEEEERKRLQKPVEVFMTESMKLEKENTKKINDAVAKGQACLHVGDRKGAIKWFESVQNLVSYQTEYGGDVLLELGMALETVPDRVEDSRKVYAKLASTSWSPKVRRQALQLLQGLDITRQLRSDISVAPTPTIDYEAM